MKKIVVITGQDGTGKSTLIKHLAQSGLKVSVATIWDSFKSSPFQSKDQIDNYLATLSPDARVLFLSHALKEALNQALKSTMGTILFNAYYYKYFASESAYGASPDLIRSLTHIFPDPDYVIRLKLNAKVCYSRKGSLSKYECGFALPGEQTFLAFQERVSPQWKQFDQQTWTELSAQESPDFLAASVQQIIN